MPSANVGAGETYTTLADWWTAIKDSATDTYEAVLTSDLSAAQTISTAGTNNKSIVIRTNGTRRTITNDVDWNTLTINAAVITDITIQDITIDGNSQAGTSNHGISIGSAVVNCDIVLSGVIFKGNAGANSDCFFIVNNASATTRTYLFENCLFISPGDEGIYIGDTTPTVTTTIRHCGFYGTPGNPILIDDNANHTVGVYNCWFMNNTSNNSFGASCTVTMNNCVTSAGTVGTGVDTSTGNAVSQTSYATYFTDYTNGDFTLTDDDFALWGIDSDGTNSPATDLAGTTRTTDDIGPYEFASAVAPTITSVTLTGTSQIGNTLTATVVTDQDPVDSTAYQWEKASDGSGTGAADISGETSSTLALTYADFGDLLDTAAYVRCGAIATKNALPSDEAFSAWQQVTVPSSAGLVSSPLKSPFLIA